MGSTVPFSMGVEQDLNEELKEERAIFLGRLDEADAGVFVFEERVIDWVNSWFTEDELPQPTADTLPTNK